MNRYTFFLNHDHGKVEISTAADNLNSAMKILQMAENCPENAIYKIKIKPIKKHGKT